MSIEKRTRRSAIDVRAAAMVEARRLLLAEGPNAVTLKAVGAALGMSHANLIHHFGSAAGMQAGLVEDMLARTRERVRLIIADVRTGAVAPRALVDLVFDNFEKEGTGKLVGWLILSGEAARLGPMMRGIHDLVDAIEADVPEPQPHTRADITTATLLLVLTAIGDSLAGPELHAAVGREPEAARDALAALVAGMMPAPGGQAGGTGRAP